MVLSVGGFVTVFLYSEASPEHVDWVGGFVSWWLYQLVALSVGGFAS